MIKKVATLKDLMELKASDIMTSPVTKVHMWDSIHDVAKILTENNISSAAVVDIDDIPIGVITKSDLTRYGRERPSALVAEKNKNPARAAGASEDPVRSGFHLEPEEVTIEHWMTPAFLDVHPATILPAVVKKMFKNGLHHVFVTEGDKKKVTGVITTFDVLMVMNRVLNPEN